jgi:hypothetical protein
VFDEKSSLVEIFNLLIVPGDADNLVLSTALSFAELKRAFATLRSWASAAPGLTTSAKPNGPPGRFQRLRRMRTRALGPGRLYVASASSRRLMQIS